MRVGEVVSHRTHYPKIAGSFPAPATILILGLAQSSRALALGARGRGSKAFIRDHIQNFKAYTISLSRVRVDLKITDYLLCKSCYKISGVSVLTSLTC